MLTTEIHNSANKSSKFLLCLTNKTIDSSIHPIICKKILTKLLPHSHSEINEHYFYPLTEHTLCRKLIKQRMEDDIGKSNLHFQLQIRTGRINYVN